jgi:hypothetical protein
MKRVAVLIALGLLVFAGTLRASDTLWTRLSHQTDNGAGMAVTIIGNDIYAAGTVTSPSREILLVKYRDDDGDTVWSRVLSLDPTAKTVGVVVGPDSAPVVCAADTGGLGALSLAKFNKNGDTIWTRRRFSFMPTGVATDAQNAVFVYGSCGGPGTDESLALVKYSSHGVSVFDHAWRVGTSHVSGGCAADANGNIFGAATVTDLGGQHPTLLKFDGLGDTLWSRQYADLAGGELQGVAVEPNGCIVLADENLSTLNVVKFGPNGDELWNHAAPGNGTLGVYANIAVDDDSNIVVPVSNSMSTGMVCVLDAQGTQQGFLSSSLTGQLRSVAFGSDGLPVAVGSPTPSSGCLTVKFSAWTAIDEPANPSGFRAGRFLVEGIVAPGQPISLSLPRAGSYAISILSENGALVRQVNRAYLPAGEFRFAPGRLAAGSYYLRVAGPTGTVQEKFVQLH